MEILSFVSLALSLTNGFILGFVTIKGNRKLEVLKSKLSTQTHVTRIQFETEFDAYKKIWETLVKAKYSVLLLRPFLDYQPHGESEEERKTRRLTEFSTNFDKFFQHLTS